MNYTYGNNSNAKSVTVFNSDNELLQRYDCEKRMAEDINVNYNTVRTWFKRHGGRFYYKKRIYDINNTSNSNIN